MTRSDDDRQLAQTPDGTLDVLIISSYYWPERAGNAPYVTGVAEYLAARGHRVMVATGFPHYPEWRSTGRSVLGTRENRAGVEIRRRPHYVPAAQSLLTRAVYETSLCASGLMAFPKRAPDVIVGVSPTLAGAVLARMAATLYKRPYGIVFQDLQGLGAFESGIKGGRGIASAVQWTEVTLARGAAAVGVIADGFRSYFESHGVSPERVHSLPNWSQDAVPTEAHVDTRRRLGWSQEEFVCLHAGNMGHKQGLENVLHAAAALREHQIRIVLAGDGNERTKLEGLAAHLGLVNVSFLPPQPSGLYESMLRAADVLLVNQRSTVSTMSLASKLTSYFAAARPVLAAVADRSETAREIERSGAGVLIPPDDPQALAEAILRIKDHDDGPAEYLGARGRRYAEGTLSASAVLERYEAFIETVGRARWRHEVRPWRAIDPEPVVLRASTPTRSPRTSIVIVSFDCRDALGACLASLEEERDALPAEVIVVDNASTDGTVRQLEERFPWVEVIANRANVGFARGVNQGFRRARGDTILVLNPDTVVPAGSVAKALEELERHPDAGMLGVKLTRPDGTFDHACKRGFPTISAALFYFLGLHRLRPRSSRFAQYTFGSLSEDESGEVDAINGAFMLVRREAAEDVGPMDERYWLYAEDLDWCHSFWAHGWKVLYWPGVEVIHRKGGSAGDFRPWTLNRAFHRSMWLFYEKHHAPRQSRLLTRVVWAGIWGKFALSAIGNALRRPPIHGWREGGVTSRGDSRGARGR